MKNYTYSYTTGEDGATFRAIDDKAALERVKRFINIIVKDSNGRTIRDDSIKNFGNKVTVKIRIGVGVLEKIITNTYRNVTEIHFNYENSNKGESFGKFFGGPGIAFESDIHKTGATWRIKQVVEFETELETEIAKEF